tara:strand:- start:4074 stop:4595 length:522 start_codon:yes stop_codon:yes gene_type:complete
MALNPSTGATPSETTVQDQIQRGIDLVTLLTPAQIGSELAQAYFDYSKAGILLGADLTVGGTKSLLDAAFTTDNTAASIDAMAAGICNYWDTNNAVGTPAHGGTVVVSVAINAAAKIPAMKSAIESFIISQSPAGFLGLYQATEAVVKTFACVITETIVVPPPVDTPFPETIS